MKSKIMYFFVFLSVSSYAQLETISLEYEYDNLNRLVQVVSNGETTRSYTYDNLGNRLDHDTETDDGLTYVPDDAFEQELIDLGYDDVLDDYVITNNINQIIDINLFDLNIDDATGIEDFSALEELNFVLNNLVTIDISENVNLEKMFINENQLTEIDVSANVNLTFIECGYNQLTSIDVTNNTNLEQLWFTSNSISELDVSNNPLLTHLETRLNMLTELDVSNNPELELLGFQNNQISQIDITQNVNLLRLYASDNFLTTVDTSNNVLLEDFIVYSNQINTVDFTSNINLDRIWLQENDVTSINLVNSVMLQTLYLRENEIIEIDLSQNTGLRNLGIGGMEELRFVNVQNGNNVILTDVYAQDSSNIECFIVDDENSANNGTGVYADWQVDNGVSFSESCTLGINDLIGSNEIIISPNPTDGFVQIQLSEDFTGNNMQYDLIDNLGKRIIKGKLESDQNVFTIDLTEIPSGTYFLTLYTNLGLSTKRIIKI